jgi:LEA14-like dessication related protein
LQLQINLAANQEYDPIHFGAADLTEEVAVTGQSWVDLALQMTGDISGLMDLFKTNLKGPESSPVAGARYGVKSVINGDVTRYFAGRGLRVATAQPLADEGIFDFTFDLTFE